VLGPLLFSTHFAGEFEEVKVYFLLASGLVLLGLLAYDLVTRPPGRVRPDLVLAGFALFALSAVVSTLFSLNPHTSWRGCVNLPAGLPVILASVVLFVAARRACASFGAGTRLLAV